MMFLCLGKARKDSNMLKRGCAIFSMTFLAVAMTGNVSQAAMNPAGAHAEALSCSVGSAAASRSNSAGATAAFASTDQRSSSITLASGIQVEVGLFDPVQHVYPRILDVNWEEFCSTDWLEAISLEGDAFLDESNCSLVLTEDVPYECGGVNFNRPQPLGDRDSISISFSFRLTQSNEENVADGFAVILSNQPHPLGSSGGWLGYGPDVPSSVGVEFDFYQNTPDVNGSEYDDPEGTHIGLNVGGSAISSAVTSAPESFGQGDWRIWMDYTNGTNLFRVWMAPDGQAQPDEAILESRIDLRSIIGKRNIYIGFTGATGIYSQRQEILSLSADNDALPPEPKNSADFWWMY